MFQSLRRGLACKYILNCPSFIQDGTKSTAPEVKEMVLQLPLRFLSLLLDLETKHYNFPTVSYTSHRQAGVLPLPEHVLTAQLC